jgi:hypothetical protein
VSPQFVCLGALCPHISCFLVSCVPTFRVSWCLVSPHFVFLVVLCPPISCFLVSCVLTFRVSWCLVSQHFVFLGVLCPHISCFLVPCVPTVNTVCSPNSYTSPCRNTDGPCTVATLRSPPVVRVIVSGQNSGTCCCSTLQSHCCLCAPRL